MTSFRIAAAALALALGVLAGGDARAWDRGNVDLFATLPDGSTGPEGLTVGTDGNVYVTTFGFNTTGPVAGPGQLFVFNKNGGLIRQVSVQGSSSHLLGLRFNSAGDLLVIDFGNGNVRKVDPTTGTSSVFITVPNPASAGLNALTFDSAGNVYVSDSFQGTIWTTGPGGGAATSWKTDPLLTTTGHPPFGANGIEFNKTGTTMYVANTGNDNIVTIAVSGGVAGAATAFTESINGADGLALDSQGNIWAAANQADEIVVVYPTGKAIAKLGDFRGLDNAGVPRGLLFPASPAFSPDGQWLYVSNLALDLRLFGLPQSVDSQWTAKVKRYTVSRIKAKIPPFPDAN